MTELKSRSGLPPNSQINGGIWWGRSAVSYSPLPVGRLHCHGAAKKELKSNCISRPLSAVPVSSRHQSVGPMYSVTASVVAF